MNFKSQIDIKVIDEEGAESCSSTPSSGRVFNIQRYSLNDGEGIRTVVFFKGCQLKCPWCSNPESRSIKVHTIKREAKCIHCDTCDMDVDECPTGAIELIGKDMTLDEILKEIAKDEIFYRTSGGGITLSGGEILTQGAFAVEVLQKLHQLGYHTAIETTGHGNLNHLLKIGELCNEVLFDFKIMDEALAKQVIGINLKRVLHGFDLLYQQGTHLIPRLPLIPGYTMDRTNVDKILQFLRPYKLDEIHLLPFHQYGSGKYDTLDMEYTFKQVEVPTKDEVAAIKKHIETQGYKVVIGG